MGKLDGKVAIVAGASKGIGASIATHLAGEGTAVAVQADVSRQADVDRLLAETSHAYGRVDILVNNAGAYEFAPLPEVNEAHIRRLLDVNVLGPLINISSIVGQRGVPNAAVYSATKAAVEAITRSLVAGGMR